MEPRRPVQFYVLVVAMLAAPFLGLLIDPNLGLLAMAAALGAVMYVIFDARSQVGPAHQQRLLLVAAGLGLLLLATLALLLARLVS